MNGQVRIRRESVTLPTYEPAAPDKNPMFLEKRVYQGSSGRVYPLPFTDRIAETPTDREWDAIFLDNGLIEVMLLPEIGGRIHAGRDLSNGYEFFYRQHVIKPALVGLAGPWISGGVEFNWPQHHRPSTFMPTDVSIEHGEDGSITVWMGEHEPMDRTKGMHGICLHPDRTVIEVKVRLYNRTPYVQTFLWWANIATHVHEGYKSFFPPDAHMVADHAKRALSQYPLAEGHYYGVDYGARGRDGVPAEEVPSNFVPANQGGTGPEYAANDLSWYANIPVPTSYMCMGTKDEFVGGYDFFAKSGLLHLADRHISPGKKQWTWGNHEFGYAWDRNLTDADGPYIELMAGVYTDNQPDFSWIAPGETKTFSQFWYPYQAIGPVHFANLDTAISVTSDSVGVAVTRPLKGRVVVGEQEWDVDLAPSRPFIQPLVGAGSVVLFEGSKEIARYEVSAIADHETASVATEPALPTEIESADELFLTGQHLAQYRHATRSAADYWREALRRDPGDLRCNNALGLWHFRRGEFDLAETCFRQAIARATRRNPNPYDGEPYYNLGLTLRSLNRDDEAMDAFGKAVWNSAWQAPGYHVLGELACKRGDLLKALDFLDRSIRKDADNFRAHCLRAVVLRKLGQEVSLDEVLALDPLDHWARMLSGEEVSVDNGVRLDIAIDYTRAGLAEEALEVLAGADLEARDGTAPMVAYYMAALGSGDGAPWSEVRAEGGTVGEGVDSLSGIVTHPEPLPPAPSPRRATWRGGVKSYALAASLSPDYCFPSRLEDIAVLQSAPATDARAAYYLGNLLYDRRRHEEAIQVWERSASLDPSNAIVHRNLGIGYFNVLHDEGRARAAYHAAVHADPEDARLRYERDQLWKRVGVGPEERLAELRQRMDLVQSRDDLTIEFCALLNAAGHAEEAAEILASRKFQPWEGGEGMALGIYARTHVALGNKVLASDPSSAKAHFEQALNPPENLSEARHLLANASDIWLALGDACAALGEAEEAHRWWTRAAGFRGDFQEMSVLDFSELTYFQALALDRLGKREAAQEKFWALDAYAERLGQATAKIDYFATSLPTMLLFDDDLQVRQENAARFMKAQALAGLGRTELAEAILLEVLSVDPNHALAHDLRTRLTQ
jgi:tetratricopeptide (TPR) repeat protein